MSLRFHNRTAWDPQVGIQKSLFLYLTLALSFAFPFSSSPLIFVFLSSFSHTHSNSHYELARLGSKRVQNRPPRLNRLVARASIALQSQYGSQGR